jgi:hypothetical protein
MLRALLLFSVLYSQMGHAIGGERVCHPLLWPVTSVLLNPSRAISNETKTTLQRWSDKFLDQPARPVRLLSSSGRTNISDPDLIASRLAMKDADIAAILAISYRVTGNINYFNKARYILTRWATINNPTGQPIDETRLEGMIWAYDLIACDLPERDQTLILHWFRRMYTKKLEWKFGRATTMNNHRIHQLKMMLLLDKVLHDDKRWASDKASAIKYSSINLQSPSGVSIDYLERSALYYHNYVMQPWIEISLVTGCCGQSVYQGFSFLSHKIVLHQTDKEFSNSKAKIDALRAQGGFTYAKRGGTFDLKKAALTIIAFYTLSETDINPKLLSIVEETKPSPRMVFLSSRKQLWNP